MLAIKDVDATAELYTAKIISTLVGVFFMLLGIYWILVYWWSRHGNNGPNAHRDFSPLAILWWLLSLYFTGVFFSLLTEAIDKRDHDYLGRNCSGQIDNRSVSCYNWIVPSALSCMAAFELVYLLIFFCLTAKRCVDKYRRRNLQQIL